MTSISSGAGAGIRMLMIQPGMLPIKIEKRRQYHPTPKVDVKL
jgi:hypothetical protein